MGGGGDQEYYRCYASDDEIRIEIKVSWKVFTYKYMSNVSIKDTAIIIIIKGAFSKFS